MKITHPKMKHLHQRRQGPEVMKKNSNVHSLESIMGGKCRYMTKVSKNLSSHMKSSHPSEKHPGYKITEYPGFKDREVNDFVTKPYPELKNTDPKLAEEVLALYERPRNKNSRNVHLCGYFDKAECKYFSINTGNVKCHMARQHSRVLPIISYASI